MDKLTSIDMGKQFVLPFRLWEKELRAVLDANGKEVVVFPEGCEYMADDYVKRINEDMHGYSGGLTAGDVAMKCKCAVGKIGCQHCGIVSIGAIHENQCAMCGNDRFK